MHTYLRKWSHLFCGHWNGSPIEISFMPEPLKRVSDSEVMHYHDSHEYYVFLEGNAQIL